MSMNLSDAEQSVLIEELADCFATQPDAVVLLAKLNIKESQLPPFSSTTPMNWWHSVCQKLRLGMIQNGLEQLVRAAAAQYPGNPVFKRLSGDDDHHFDHSNEKRPERDMQKQLRLEKKIAALHKQWELLGEGLSALQEQRILETRIEEKLRLKGIIEQAQAERDQVEEQLQNMESQLSQTVKMAGQNDNRSRASAVQPEPKHPNEISGDMELVLPANLPDGLILELIGKAKKIVRESGGNLVINLGAPK